MSPVVQVAPRSASINDRGGWPSVRFYEWAKCEHPVDGAVCGREFPKEDPRQVVCGEHSLARRIELQRQRTAHNRDRKRAKMRQTALIS